MSEQRSRDGLPVDIRYVRVSTRMFDDEKVKVIESMPEKDTIHVIWLKLLLQAGRCNADGYLFLAVGVPFTDETLAAVCDRPLQTVRMAMQLFRSWNMICDDERTGYLFLPNWGKHQNTVALENIRQKNAERQRKHRLSQQANGMKLLPSPSRYSNVTSQNHNVTEQNSNVTVTLQLDDNTDLQAQSRDSNVTVSPQEGEVISNKEILKEIKEKRDITFHEMLTIWETNTSGRLSSDDAQILEDISDDFAVELFERAVKQSVREQGKSLRIRYVDRKLRGFGVKDSFTKNMAHRTTDEELREGAK